MRSKKSQSKLRAKQVQQKYKKQVGARKKSLAAKLLNAKGKHFSGMFNCAMCGNKHTDGYVYKIEGKEYEICKFCNDSVFMKPNFIKIIYTPMGNNQ